MDRIERLYHTRIFALIIHLALMSVPVSVTLFGQETKGKLFREIERDQEKYERIAMETWNNPELGYQEFATSKALAGLLQEAGFEVETGVAGIPTAFIASFGSGRPVIGILAEYDALPGMSQRTVWFREPVAERAPGHGCGHHLFGTASAAAGIAVKNWLQSAGRQGTIRVYGSPAEEGGAGKVYMLRAGLFEDLDAVLHWHPDSKNSADPESSLSNKTAKFRFYGVSTHAAKSPEQGRSALDAVEAMNHMVNLMREHLPQETRIHYVITDGGKAPNIVPDFAEVFYYVRHPDKTVVDSTFRWITHAAIGAAMGTGTSVDSEILTGLYNILPNITLAETMHRNLRLVGGVEYDEQEKEFAEKIAATLNSHPGMNAARVVAPFNETARGTFSSDVGDVSWNVPTTGLRTSTWVPGTTAHSWQAVSAGGTSIGIKGMIVAAKTLAACAYDLFEAPDILQQAKYEFLQKTGEDFTYRPLMDRTEPPLEYRNQ